MARPKIVQGLFANDGAGPLLRKDIIPGLDEVREEFHEQDREIMAKVDSVIAKVDGLIPAPGTGDRGATLEVSAEGKYALTRELRPGVRNLVLAGRHKDGLPAYIVPGYGEFFDMSHEPGFKLGSAGTVSSDGQYDGNYGPERVLSNQHVYSGYYFHTKNGVPTAVWEYAFKEERVLVGMWMKHHDPNQSPKHWRLEGFNEAGSEWETLYERDDVKHGPTNAAIVLKEYGTMFRFHENRKSYKRIRLNVDQSHGTVVQISAVRFYERACDAQIDKFDAALAASPEAPFKASIACGLKGDYRVSLERDVVIPGRMLAEMSRNHLYLVPANEDGSCPDYVRADRATYLEDAGAYLVNDLRKVNHGSLTALKKQCLIALQCRETQSRNTNLTDYIEIGAGAWAHRVYGANLQIRADMKPGGAAASWSLVSGDTFIYQNQDAKDSYKDKLAHNTIGARDFTLEMDVSYEGQTPEQGDPYYVLFDSGYYESRGFMLAYYHRRGYLAAYINGAWHYAAPCVLDAAMHTVSVSKRSDKLFIHLDGKCIGFYNNCPEIKPYYNYWMIGRWVHTSGYHWRGCINNVRYILGDCLRQNEDYDVPAVFSRHSIPDRTLWWDAIEGVVKEWQADTETWRETPMLPIGHIDTGEKEHLHTESPTGTYGTYNILGVLPDSWQHNGIYSATYPAPAILNFGDNSTYLCPSGAANNTSDYWISFELSEPASFEELRLVKSYAGWNNEPCLLLWDGSEDGQTWHRLINRSLYVRDGGLMQENHRNSYDVHSFKRFPYQDQTRFKHYRITFPAKGDIPFYQGTYTCCRLRLILREATPEITGCSAYVVGDTFTYGPVMLNLNTDYVFPAPFGCGRVLCGRIHPGKGRLAEQGAAIRPVKQLV